MNKCKITGAIKEVYFMPIRKICPGFVMDTPGTVQLPTIVSHDGKAHEIRLASKTGGRAGKGKNRTSTVQVWYLNCFVEKQYRFNVDSLESKEKAIFKALCYCMGKVKAIQYMKREGLLNRKALN